MKHFLLFYEVAPDCLVRSGAFRAGHLHQAWDAPARGELIVGGALADPADGAVLLFAGQDSGPADAFARADPYVVNGLVENWYVREWTIVVGELAATPVRP